MEEFFLSVLKEKFQQDESPISHNFNWGLAESNILRKWVAGADLTIRCRVP
jgi:hypothetical protein